MKDLALKVETLEKSLHVSSPLGTRVSVDMICRGCELEISESLLIVDLRVIDMSEFDVILGMDWLMGHRVCKTRENAIFLKKSQNGNLPL